MADQGWSHQRSYHTRSSPSTGKIYETVYCKVADPLQAVAAEHEKEQERMREAASSRRGGGGGGRPPIGRGDARNFSGGGMMAPPEFKSTVGLDDIRRLQNRNTSRQTSSQQAPTFGPSSMFASTRGSNTRKPLFGKAGEDSGASSRTGTPPAQKEKKEKEDKETSKNAFR